MAVINIAMIRYLLRLDIGESEIVNIDHGLQATLALLGSADHACT